MTKAVDPMARKKGKKKTASHPALGNSEVIIRDMASALREHADYLDSCIVAYERLGRPPMNVLTGKFYLRLRHIRETFNIQIVGKMQKAGKGMFESHHEIFGSLINRLGELADRMKAARERHL